MATNVGDLEKMAKYAFFDYQFQQSIDLFTQAIDLNPNNPHHYADRARAYLGISLFKEALADSNKAIQLDPSLPKAYLQKGAALLRLNEYEAAESEFQTGAALDPQHPRFATFINMCDKLKAHEGISFSSDGLITDSDSSPTVSVSSDDPDLEFSHEYFQSLEDVFVTIYASKIPAECVSVYFGEQILDVRIDIPGQEPYHLQLKLFGKIIPDKCTYKVGNVAIDIFLAKAPLNDSSCSYEWWSDLEAFEDRLEASEYRPTKKIRF